MPSLHTLRDHMMSGVSYMIPVVVTGGILSALSIVLNGVIPDHITQTLSVIGSAAFSLMIPVLAGFIAHAIAERVGLVPGLVGGVLALQLKTGFIGGILAGFLAGYTALWIKKLPVNPVLETVMRILLIPVLSSTLVGGVMIYLIGTPVSYLMTTVTIALKTMGTSSSISLALVMGAMIAFDMGGPVNKVASLFAIGMLSEGIYTIMGFSSVAVCVPPIGLAVATFLVPHKFTKSERDAASGALTMGFLGITEGAIPFALNDPFRVIPSIMAGSAAGAAVAAYFKVANHAPQSSLIVIPVIDNRLMYLLALCVGITITASMISMLKKRVE
jgi:fructose PTS system EIIBC or EIIC component